MMLGSPNISYVPSWDAPSPVSVSSEQPADFDLVFAGSEYVMNVRGLVNLLRTHGRWLSKYRIAVCGRVCDDPALIEAAAPFSNVTLLGFVDRVEDVYSRSKAALAPVDGTGMKIKVATALAAGLPVFASAQCLEGLAAGFEDAVFEIDETQVSEILGDISKLRAAKKAALRYDTLLKTSGNLLPFLATLRSSFQQS
jgi:glycosyltransferase involved in cell wall biosynthesis